MLSVRLLSIVLAVLASDRLLAEIPDCAKNMKACVMHPEYRDAAARISAFLPDERLAAQAPDCTKDLDACVTHAVLENATFVVECAKLYPESKGVLESAYASWGVLKLPIPGVLKAISEESDVRRMLSEQIRSHLRRIPEHARQRQCSVRLFMMQDPVPRLWMADSVSLPPDALRRYIK
jgi:hypothetical protein